MVALNGQDTEGATRYVEEQRRSGACVAMRVPNSHEESRSDTWLGRVNMMVGNGAKDTRDRKQTSWKKS